MTLAGAPWYRRRVLELILALGAVLLSLVIGLLVLRRRRYLLRRPPLRARTKPLEQAPRPPHIEEAYADAERGGGYCETCGALEDEGHVCPTLSPCPSCGTLGFDARGCARCFSPKKAARCVHMIPLERSCPKCPSGRARAA